MVRFAGIKDDYIRVITDESFNGNDLLVIQIPEEFDHLTSSDLILNCRFINGELKHKKCIKQVKDIKLALVGNWKMKCGISTYSENLWGEIVNHIDNFKLFIEENDSPTGDIHLIGNKVMSDEQVVSCWKRGESLKNLIIEIKKYNPDVILIQHEFGLWSNACYWLSLMNQLSDYKIIVTMHSVYHHKDKTICEAAIPNIVTHLQGGYDVLKNEKEIPGNVYVIPHGCNSYDDSKLWNFYKSDKTFMQFGFGFRYKGWENSIRTAALLKKKYPDVFFTGLFSESSFNSIEHQMYYAELMKLIDELDVQENVAIIRGYQSDSTLDSYLRTNRATIFPYVSHPLHEVFGASGAARFAMARGLPVITSNINHFSDLNTIKADTPEQMAFELDKLFCDEALIKKQVELQKVYVEENSWKKVALKYLEIFKS